jgi:hypothetical protein
VHRSPWWHQVAAGLAIAAITLAVPLIWPATLRLWGPAPGQRLPSYLPALERERARGPFVATPIQELRDLQPVVVTIGDSMAGRIEPDLLGRLAGGPVAPILQNATGSAYWYLVFKNYVLASGVRPRWVVVFFRDTNMTDVLFRLDGPYRANLDEVAGPAEPELNAIVEAGVGAQWNWVHRALDRAYDVERTREWLEPNVTTWPAGVVAGVRQPQLLERINNAFTLEKLRPMAQADVAAADVRTLDFHGQVEASVLPLFFSGARDTGIRLCFVRVLRRPVDGRPPDESPALLQYSADMKAYVEAHGGVYFDDRDDPELARLPYADGDHVSRDAREPYTRNFWRRLQGQQR